MGPGCHRVSTRRLRDRSPGDIARGWVATGLRVRLIAHKLPPPCPPHRHDRRTKPGDETRHDLSRIRRGDDTAFAALYERIAPDIFAWASLRVSPAVQRRADPEDIVQEVWWRAMDSFGRYDPEKASFRTWIFRIATNVLLETYRRGKVRNPHVPDARAERIEALPPVLATQATSISRTVARSDDARRLVELLRELPDDERALFLRCGIEGLNPKAASELLQLSHDACVKRWQRLRARLKESEAWRQVLERH